LMYFSTRMNTEFLNLFIYHKKGTKIERRKIEER
jgi:hypothetical protein